MADPTLAEVAADESLAFPSFDAGTAWRLGSAIRQEAATRILPVAIEVSLAGQQLFFAAMAGATPDNAEWIRRKRNVVTRFHRSSLRMRLECEAKGISLSERYGLDPRDFAASGGGFPIRLAGTGCVGVVVVSGLPDVEDHALIVAAIRTMLGEAASHGGAGT